MRGTDLINSIRKKAFQLRGGVWTLLFAVIVVLASPTARSVSLGLPFVVLGQALRFWAAGSIRRYRGEQVGAQVLTTWGPYAFVRNPLYVGNGLIGFGWGLMAGFWAALIFVVTFILLYTVLIVPYEESFLSGKFGEEYARYKRATGRFIPKAWPAGRIAGPFDKGILWRSERYSFVTTVVGSVLIIARHLAA